MQFNNLFFPPDKKPRDYFVEQTPPKITSSHVITAVPLLRSHFHAFPEGDVAFDVFGIGLGFGVIPRGVFVCFAVNDDVVVARRAFPAADGVRRGRLEIGFVNAAFGEVMVAFDDDSFVAFGDGFAVPCCFHNV